MNNEVMQELGDMDRQGLIEDTPRHDTWPLPDPLTRSTAALTYPLDALPDIIREAVTEIQDFVQAPVAMVSSCALSGVSVAVQSLVNVERTNGLTGPVSLNNITIADSGERKTSTDNFFTKVIRAHETEQEKQARPLRDKYQADFASWTAKKEGLISAIKQATKTGKPTVDIEMRLHDLEKEEPIRPKIPRLLYHDTTPEGLGKGLKEWPSGAVISSEAGAVFGGHGMNHESLMRSLSQYNILWDGATLRVDRRGDGGSYTLKNARLTVSLQVQPETLTAFMDKNGQLARGTGFFSRFLISRPTSTQGTRLFKEPPTGWPAMSRFNGRLETLLNTPAPLDADGVLEPTTLRFTPEGKTAWIGLYDSIEKGLKTGGELTDIRDVASKAGDNIARLAALFHTFENGPEGEVSRAHIEAAGRLIAWHLLEAKRFFQSFTISAEDRNLAALDTWLVKYCRDHGTASVSTGTISTYGPGRLRKKENYGPALSKLEALGRIRLLQKGRHKDISINPRLLGGATK